MRETLCADRRDVAVFAEAPFNSPSRGGRSGARAFQLSLSERLRLDLPGLHEWWWRQIRLVLAEELTSCRLLC